MTVRMEIIISIQKKAREQFLQSRANSILPASTQRHSKTSYYLRSSVRRIPIGEFHTSRVGKRLGIEGQG